MARVCVLTATVVIVVATACVAAETASQHEGVLRYLTEEEFKLIESQSTLRFGAQPSSKSSGAQPGSSVKEQAIGQSVSQTADQIIPVVEPKPDDRLAMVESEETRKSIKAAEGEAFGERSGTDVAASEPSKTLIISKEHEPKEEAETVDEMELSKIEAERSLNALRLIESSAKASAQEETVAEVAPVKPIETDSSGPTATLESETADVEQRQPKERKQSIKEALRLMEELERRYEESVQ